MWLTLAVVSAICLGCYDIFKKASVRDNNVLVVLWLNTLFGTLLMSWVIVRGLANGYWGLEGSVHGHLLILLKGVIVLSSWVLGYFAIKHLPLTIQGPINATRPVIVLIGALAIFGERLSTLQWIGILLGFASLFLISRIGSREGFSMKNSRWLWMSIGATVLGAVSALYDKYLLRTYQPLEVQAWYSLYQLVMMSVVVVLITRVRGRRAPSGRGADGRGRGDDGCGRGADAQGTPFVWRWSIPFISIFLTIADMAYFYSLSFDESMVAVVSMIRRGSVLVSFFYGVVVLRERHVRSKLIDLCILLISLVLLILGAK